MPKCYLPPVIRGKELLITTFSQTVGYQISTHNIPDIWAQTQGEGIKIAVLDTGCDREHEDIVGGVVGGENVSAEDEIRRYCRQTNNKNRCRKYLKKIRGNYKDGDGHGTHVSGIIRATNNTFGIVGVAPKVSLYTIKVLDDNGLGTYDGIALGIQQALDQGCDIINMSLGGSESASLLHDAIKEAYNVGVPVICAAGNSGDVRKAEFPARYPETIAIGALNKENLRAEFSQTGGNLDFMAPGVDILSLIPGGRYQVMSGTSMATPWVTGVVALMMAKHRKYGGQTPVETVEDVKEHLRKTAIDFGDAGKDREYGFGLVDVQKAINELSDEDLKLTLEERVELLESKVLQLESLVA
jgi:subtilisin family serine protease